MPFPTAPTLRVGILNGRKKETAIQRWTIGKFMILIPTTHTLTRTHMHTEKMQRKEGERGDGRPGTCGTVHDRRKGS